MRIITGRFKGRRLAAPSWDGLRPTSDRLRETLFNILAARVEGARVLDAFAGTGALGIEALSRGAASACFVDRDGRAVALVRENLERCGAAEGYAIIRDDVERRAASLPGAPFDLVLADPPYGDSALDAIVIALSAALAPGGLLVLEHARRRVAPQQAGPLSCVRQVFAGDSALAFYEMVQAPGAGTGRVERVIS